MTTPEFPTSLLRLAEWNAWQVNPAHRGNTQRISTLASRSDVEIAAANNEKHLLLGKIETSVANAEKVYLRGFAGGGPFTPIVATGLLLPTRTSARLCG